MSPSEYRKLTVAEYQAFLRALEQRGPENPLEGLM